MRIFQFLILAGLAISCQKEDDHGLVGKELLADPFMEDGVTVPAAWWSDSEATYIKERSREHSVSPDYSLKISTMVSDPVNFASWGQSYTGEIPTGHDVLLSVKVKGVDVEGAGLAIVLRGDDTLYPLGDAEQFISSQSIVFAISGTFDWTTYEVRLPNVKQEIKSLTVYFIFLSNTTGTAYFDDASLVVQ